MLVVLVPIIQTIGKILAMHKFSVPHLPPSNQNIQQKKARTYTLPCRTHHNIHNIRTALQNIQAIFFYQRLSAQGLPREWFLTRFQDVIFDFIKDLKAIYKINQIHCNLQCFYAYLSTINFKCNYQLCLVCLATS